MSKEISLKVEGMHCASCAMNVSRLLERKGVGNVSVDYASGEVSFTADEEHSLEGVVSGIRQLGYKVRNEGAASGSFLSSLHAKFFFCLVFTLPLLLHMFVSWHLLHDPVVQLLLSLPVMVTGFAHFGKSAWKSLRAGVPNMDVLITMGSGAAFFYSLAGFLLYRGTAQAADYLFFETAATIITLVLLGNLIEHISVKRTTSALRDLSSVQVTKARKYIKDLLGERIVEVAYSDIRPGDLLVVNTGDKVPADGSITEGSAVLDESLVTGESIPVDKETGDKVTGGTLVVSGSFRMKAERVGKETLLSQIIRAVKNAQLKKPSIQKLGDRVSAVFVPVVVGLAALTFLISYLILDIGLKNALMNSVAVLVISCPCAMGLATPTAVMVGIGKAARRGIVIKGGDTLETLAGITTVVLDKTGTLTTGNFHVSSIVTYGKEEGFVKSLVYRLEQGSSHPLALSLVRELGAENPAPFDLAEVTEHKGLGVSGKDHKGNTYQIGSYRTVKHLTDDSTHALYVTENDRLIAAVDIRDSMKEGVAGVVDRLRSQGIRVIMLSGDSESACREAAAQAGVDEYYSQRLPAEKLEIVEKLAGKGRVAMVGDGINDAPALTRADVGISLGNATSVAVQSAQVVLLNASSLEALYEAVRIGKLTLGTIRQNLFWAFAYNIVAIPLAAAGMLNPMIAAFAMGFSDVVVIGNSIRLKAKRL